MSKPSLATSGEYLFSPTAAIDLTADCADGSISLVGRWWN
jgi:hypothetical protein